MDLITHLISNSIEHDIIGGAITVPRSLDLSGPQITKLPDNLSVGGSLDLNPTRISNVAHADNCGRSKRTIFACWVNGGPRIAAGCFLGDQETFNGRVAKKYSGGAADAYKAAGDRVVKRLLEILTPEAA